LQNASGNITLPASAGWVCNLNSASAYIISPQGATAGPVLSGTTANEALVTAVDNRTSAWSGSIGLTNPN
jgi:hypothetical protein